MYSEGMEPVPGYRLAKLLGRGGFGEVWKATAPGGTEVALKIIGLGPTHLFKEYRAVKLVKEVRHPNLVSINAFWLKDERGDFFGTASGLDSTSVRAHCCELLIAMGLGDKNLHDRLAECQALGGTGIPAEELLDYLKQAAKAIDYLNQPIHNLGKGKVAIQHCDIKPQNLLIVGGAVQVCDFGLARVLGDARITSMATASAAYAAPELLTESKPSPTSDQYSLAVSYIELRTGALPFDTSNPLGAILAHTQGKLDLSKVPPEEQPVLARATERDPDRRYPTTLEMVRDLFQAHGICGSSIYNLALGSNKPPSSSEFTLEERELVPGYRMIRRIGKGGYGEVWEAVAPGGRRVALKVVRNLEDLAGKQEFKALELIKHLEHNNLIELYAYWLLDKDEQVIPDDELKKQPRTREVSTLVIASKLASKSLHHRLYECQQDGWAGIPVAELLGYMRQAAKGIDFLNSCQHPFGDQCIGIQHRDIKPENILISGDTVKICDFGLAKLLEGAEAEIHANSRGLTLSYAAPELFADSVTSWTDQYALALTYYKLRTGTMPFSTKGLAPTEIMNIHRKGKLDLVLLPEPERAVIARSVALIPENRFPSCVAMVEALERACRAALLADRLSLSPDEVDLDGGPRLTGDFTQQGTTYSRLGPDLTPVPDVEPTSAACTLEKKQPRALEADPNLLITRTAVPGVAPRHPAPDHEKTETVAARNRAAPYPEADAPRPGPSVVASSATSPNPRRQLLLFGTVGFLALSVGIALGYLLWLVFFPS